MEGYKYLSTYILATVIQDLTVMFCNENIDKFSRTHDQMVQAARSGKQNIAEGYSVQSLESYIKLVGVAEGSVRELATDYEDYLRQNRLIIYDKNDPKVRVFREFRAVWVKDNIPNTPNLPNSPQEAANMLLTFCQMETYLFRKQIAALTEKFVKEGGFKENLFRKRVEYKNRSNAK